MSLRSAYHNAAGAIDHAAAAVMRVGSGAIATDKPWHTHLQPASWRGVPFGVIGSESRAGRRVAVHEYPYRDSVWVEDMGRSPRRITITGFLVENSAVYGGGGVQAQRERLREACEREGEGELVHPTLGRLNVALLHFRTGERREAGRVIEIALTFVEAGQLLYPTSILSTLAAVTGAADALGLAAIVDFVETAGKVLQEGAAAVRQVVATVDSYVRMAERYIDDATNIYNAIIGLPGEFGRFIAPASGSKRSSSTPTAAPSGVNQSAMAGLKATAVARRAAAITAGAAARTHAAAITPGSATAVAGSIVQGVAAIARAIPTPVDRLRLLPAIAALPIQTQRETSSAAQAVGALYRRAALAELAKASASYQPDSHDDAMAARDRVCEAIDAEAVRAGDAGDDGAYHALRRLHATVAADLTERGASLARLTTVTSGAPLPSLVLAQRLYRDPRRADELARSAQPIHPAFMPTAFQALAE